MTRTPYNASGRASRNQSASMLATLPQGDEVFVADGYIREFVVSADRTQNPIVLNFAMERGQRATGRVLDPAGKPAIGVYVQVFGCKHDGKNQIQ